MFPFPMLAWEYITGESMEGELLKAGERHSSMTDHHSLGEQARTDRINQKKCNCNQKQENSGKKNRGKHRKLQTLKLNFKF